MKKLKLTQAEIDKLVTVGRIDVKPTVYGVGFNDVGFQTSIDRKNIWQYVLWKSMLKRCFSEKEKQRYPTYQNVTCCDEWISFANFFGWVNKEVGYKGKSVGMQLDKDIIVRGNSVYSPFACSFVPHAVNSLLIASDAIRGDLPIGVSIHKDRYQSQLKCLGKTKHLGYYNTQEEAFAAYKIAKEAQIKVVALQHRDVLKPALFDSLMNWEITP